MTHTPDTKEYVQDQYRPWDNWCACSDCDPDREHALQYCQDCEVDVELAENCEHNISGRTYEGTHYDDYDPAADDISGFVTLASGEQAELSQLL